MTWGQRMGAALAMALGLAAGLPTGAAAQLRPLARPADLAVPEGADMTALPAAAPPAEAGPEAGTDPALGPETGLPLPRFVSLATDEGNVRRGPSLDHRIDWVFLQRDMPLLVTAEFGNWRRIEDREGFGGWVHYALLSGTRTVIVDEPMTPLRVRPDGQAREAALLEAGVVARLEACEGEWCRLSAGGHGGWAPRSALWGVGVDEAVE